jgi:hypothetical protein
VDTSTGRLYPSTDAALRAGVAPSNIAEVPRSFGRIPRFAGRTTYEAYRRGGAAAKLLKGQRRRSGGRRA